MTYIYDAYIIPTGENWREYVSAYKIGGYSDKIDAFSAVKKWMRTEGAIDRPTEFVIVKRDNTGYGAIDRKWHGLAEWAPRIKKCASFYE